MAQEIRLPDIGDFKDVPIIEILVAPGQSVRKEATILTLESDKATLDVPAPEDGRDRRDPCQGRRQGEPGEPARDLCKRGAGQPAAAPAPPAAARQRPPRPGSRSGCAAACAGARHAADFEAEVLVLRRGAGRLHRRLPRRRPRAEGRARRARATLGGVCLNVGCIPSKALLHVAKTIDEAAAMARAWRELRAARDRPRRDPRLEGRGRQAVDGRASPASPGSAR